MYKFLPGLLLALCATAGAHAQTVEGDWQGTLKSGPFELRMDLHITKDDKGSLKGTADSIDQNAMGLPISSINLKESTLKFEIAVVDGSYEGKLSPDGTKIQGTWSQNSQDLPLEFTRMTARAEAKKKVLKPSDIDGDWEGTFDTGGGSLRLVLHILNFEDGLTAKLDSVDQNANGLPVTTITRDEAKLKFLMKQIDGNFEGTFNKELTELTGTWSQLGNSSPLALKRVKPVAK